MKIKLLKKPVRNLKIFDFRYKISIFTIDNANNSNFIVYNFLIFYNLENIIVKLDYYFF